MADKDEINIYKIFERLVQLETKMDIESSGIKAIITTENNRIIKQVRLNLVIVLILSILHVLIHLYLALRSIGML